jgi:hypothetical protein
MNRASGPVRHALQDLRHTVGQVAALADAILLGGPSDATLAMSKIQAALRMLAHRTQRAIEALEGEDHA